MKSAIPAFAAAGVILLAACGGNTPAAVQTPADHHLCAAASALKQHPGFQNFLAVGKAGKAASATLRNDVIKLAQAAFNGPKSAVHPAEHKLYSDCGL